MYLSTGGQAGVEEPGAGQEGDAAVDAATSAQPEAAGPEQVTKPLSDSGTAATADEQQQEVQEAVAKLQTDEQGQEVQDSMQPQAQPDQQQLPPVPQQQQATKLRLFLGHVPADYGHCRQVVRG